MAPTPADACLALERFGDEFDAKYPKALPKLDHDWKHLTAFYDHPAERWPHLRASNAIESSFATVKLRTGSRKAPAPSSRACGGLPAARRRDERVAA